MRSTPDTPTDALPTLGAPLRPAAPTPTPRATETAGVMRGADGRVFTNAPAPWVYVAPVVHVDDEPDPAPASTLSAEERQGLADLAKWLLAEHFAVFDPFN